MTSNKFHDHPFYVKAKQIWEAVRIRQIDKGAEKYPEPLNPKSWTARQLLDHGIMENVDQLHYFVALYEKVDEMEATITRLEAELKEATHRANKAEKERQDTLVMADRERRKWANLGR
jgi:predicted  nucleic acid-binding Zn-ribbon protein